MYIGLLQRSAKLPDCPRDNAAAEATDVKPSAPARTRRRPRHSAWRRCRCASPRSAIAHRGPGAGARRDLCRGSIVRMPGVAGKQGAEAQVVVDVLVVVDVDHSGSGGVLDDDRPWFVGLEARRHPRRHHLLGAFRRDLRSLRSLRIHHSLPGGDFLGTGNKVVVGCGHGYRC